MYDLTKSFDDIALAGGVLMALGAVLLLGLGRYHFGLHEMAPPQDAPGHHER